MIIIKIKLSPTSPDSEVKRIFFDPKAFSLLNENIEQIKDQLYQKLARVLAPYCDTLLFVSRIMPTENGQYIALVTDGATVDPIKIDLHLRSQQSIKNNQLYLTNEESNELPTLLNLNETSTISTLLNGQIAKFEKEKDERKSKFQNGQSLISYQTPLEPTLKQINEKLKQIKEKEFTLDEAVELLPNLHATSTYRQNQELASYKKTLQTLSHEIASLSEQTQTNEELKTFLAQEIQNFSLTDENLNKTLQTIITKENMLKNAVKNDKALQQTCLTIITNQEKIAFIKEYLAFSLYQAIGRYFIHLQLETDKQESRKAKLETFNTNFGKFVQVYDDGTLTSFDIICEIFKACSLAEIKILLDQLFAKCNTTYFFSSDKHNFLIEEINKVAGLLATLDDQSTNQKHIEPFKASAKSLIHNASFDWGDTDIYEKDIENLRNDFIKSFQEKSDHDFLRTFSATEEKEIVENLVKNYSQVLTRLETFKSESNENKTFDYDKKAVIDSVNIEIENIHEYLAAFETKLPTIKDDLRFIFPSIQPEDTQEFKEISKLLGEIEGKINILNTFKDFFNVTQLPSALALDHSKKPYQITEKQAIVNNRNEILKTEKSSLAAVAKLQKIIISLKNKVNNSVDDLAKKVIEKVEQRLQVFKQKLETIMQSISEVLAQIEKIKKLEGTNYPSPLFQELFGPFDLAKNLISELNDFYHQPGLVVTRFSREQIEKHEKILDAQFVTIKKYQENIQNHLQILETAFALEQERIAAERALQIAPQEDRILIEDEDKIDDDPSSQFFNIPTIDKPNIWKKINSFFKHHWEKILGFTLFGTTLGALGAVTIGIVPAAVSGSAAAIGLTSAALGGTASAGAGLGVASGKLTEKFGGMKEFFKRHGKKMLIGGLVAGLIVGSVLTGGALAAAGTIGGLSWLSFAAVGSTFSACFSAAGLSIGATTASIIGATTLTTASALVGGCATGFIAAATTQPGDDNHPHHPDFDVGEDDPITESDDCDDDDYHDDAPSDSPEMSTTTSLTQSMVVDEEQTASVVVESPNRVSTEVSGLETSMQKHSLVGMAQVPGITLINPAGSFQTALNSTKNSSSSTAKTPRHSPGS